MSEERKSDALMRPETGGVFESVEQLADTIREMQKRYNVLVPGGAIGGRLPVLHSAAVAFVFVEPKAETYGIAGGGVGVAKSALDRIAAAGGIQSMPHLSGRVDDGTDPHVVEFQSVGTVKQLDGTERVVSASKRIDLRAEKGVPEEKWGDDAREIARIAKAHKDRDGRSDPRDPWAQILQARQHLLSLAEAKSWNRLIRKAFGIRANYTAADIAKGFAVVRLQFTGRHEDPEVRRQVALMIADRALGSSAALYGGRRPALQSAPPRQPVPRLAAPKDEAPEPDDDGYDPETGEVHDPGSAKPTEPPPDAKVLGTKGADGKWTMVQASSLSLDAIIEKIERTERALHAGKVKRVDEANANLVSLRAWKAYREEEAIRNHVDDDSTPF
jgi:hypothetical protein